MPPPYPHWRAQKLARAARWQTQTPVEIHDPTALRPFELAAIAERITATNFALYRTADAAISHQDFLSLCRQLGLTRLDPGRVRSRTGITEIRPDPPSASPATTYIPYRNGALNWHTDGYYNPPSRRIHAFAMHTIHAADGGQNQFLDPEILYLLLRDQDPSLAHALTADDALTIPAIPDRPASRGPVFTRTANGRLHMRFTLRQRHIQWSPAPLVRTAATAIGDLLNTPSPHILTHHFRPGEGIISNNILHNRTAFTTPPNQPQRLVLRARFHDHIQTLTGQDFEVPVLE